MKTYLIAAIFFFYSPAAYAETSEDSTPPYCSKLISDLKFIHQQLSENSANIRYSTETAKQSAAALEVGLAAANKCQEENDYIRGIGRYVASYRDPHLRVKVKDSKPKGTGLLVRKLNDGYFVFASIPDIIHPKGVRIGDELISCQSKPTLNILENEILPFDSYFDKEAALYRNAYKVFFRTDVNEGDEISCRFRREQKIFEEKLRWQSVLDPNTALLPLKKTLTRAMYKFERIDGVPWVTLGSLSPQTTEEIRSLVEFVEDAKKLPAEKKVVLDLRGNGGGNSDWGDRWLKNLIGYVPKENREILVWASKDNVNHFVDASEKYSKDLPPQEKKSWEEFSACLKSKSDAFLECDSKVERAEIEAVQPTGFAGRIIILTDAGCFSSCEDFIVRLRLSGFATQVGIATDASTIFGDIRRARTPSGLAEFSIPEKVFLGEGMGQGALKPDTELYYNTADELNGIDSLKMATRKMIREGKL